SSLLAPPRARRARETGARPLRFFWVPRPRRVGASVTGPGRLPVGMHDGSWEMLLLPRLRPRLPRGNGVAPGRCERAPPERFLDKNRLFLATCQEYHTVTPAAGPVPKFPTIPASGGSET